MLLLATNCNAVFNEQFSALELDKTEDSLPAEAKDILGNLEINETISLESGMEAILHSGSEQAGNFLQQAIRSAALILITALICGMVQMIYDSSGSNAVPNYVPLVGALAITLAASSNLTSLIGMGRETIRLTDTFSKGLLGVLAASSAVIGNPASSAVKYAITVFFSDLLITAIDKLITPILYTYIAAVTANAAIGDDMLGKLSGILKSICTWILSAIITIFVFYLTVSGAISGGADAVTAKAAKLVISNAIPVVGKILSDATETVVASAGLLKNAIGIFGLLGVLAICVLPFLRLAVQYLVFKLCGAIISPVCEKRLAKLIDDLASAFGIMLGMVGGCAILLMISIVSTIMMTGV